ncbi:MAG: response regulator [Thaumarchaeota archaeon]|nr:response regulator [Nitrososphaerota archaeon]MDE1872392.1 response regulator [Nitrososphaerota archaeon]
MKILIAEDVRHTALQYKIALEDRNHQVVTTNDGEDCLRTYNEHCASTKSDSPFDIVIVDYRMPKRDGLNLAKQIRTTNPQQKILFTSAYIKEALIESLKELHGVEFIEKPFDLEDLIEVVERDESLSN